MAQTYISIPEHLREIESRNASMSYELETVLKSLFAEQPLYFTNVFITPFDDGVKINNYCF